jgi:FKBP-type peptidyl-prolyl cis-trans isomerase
MRKIIASMLAVGVLAACNDDPTGPDQTDCDPFLLSYAVATGDTVAAAQGLRYIDVKAGTGETMDIGDGVAVHYSLYRLSNGQPLQDTCVRRAPLGPILIGANVYVPGFERGLVGMRVGGVRRLIVPSALAYPAGSINQLAGVDLVWDVHMTQSGF